MLAYVTFKTIEEGYLEDKVVAVVLLIVSKLRR